MRNAIGVALGFLIMAAGFYGLTHLSTFFPVSADAPRAGAADPTLLKAPRSDKQLVKAAKDACEDALDVGTCADYSVKVGVTGDAEGLTDIRFETKTDGQGKQTSRVWATTITLNPDLKGRSDQYVRYVATHEWDHVEQTVRAGSPKRYRALQDRANAYFAPRASTTLADTTGGLELLTDCMAVLGDGAKPADGHPVTAYVERYLTSQTMSRACGSGWKDLLPR